MKKRFLISLKWLIIAYLASQAFFEIDLIKLLIRLIFDWSFELPLGLNLTNLVLFGGVAYYIVKKEWGRAKQIRYTFSPESSRLLKSQEPNDQLAREKCERFKIQFEEEMAKLSLWRLPPTMPLQLEDILTTDGFKFDEGDEAESVLQYVEELSPLEVATNAIFNWLRTEAQYKQFTLELHFKDDQNFVSVNSGNPTTDSYIRADDGSTNIPELARDAARRVFFEAESRLCRNFDVFNEFYDIVALINQSKAEPDESKRDSIEISIQEKIGDALKIEPEFLTLRLLRGIIWFLKRSKDAASIEKAEQIFEKTKNDADLYYKNYKRLRRSKTFGASTEEATLPPMVDKKVYRYTSGLSQIFLARIFCQSAHRFGAFDDDPKRFKEEFKSNLKRINKANTQIASASPAHGKRFPLAYRIKAFSYHCHDFFDKHEIFYDSRSSERKPETESDTGRDLKKAVEIYSEGITICDEIEEGAPEFALHHKDALSNQRGFSNLYFSLIEARRRNIPLREMAEFALAEQDLLWSFTCGAQRKHMALANLSVLYAMVGEYDLAIQASVCSQRKNIGELVDEFRIGERPELVIRGAPDERTISDFKTILDQTWHEAGAESPSTGNPYNESWDYFEGINEMSYGFVFKGLTQLFSHSEENDDLSALSIGIRLHLRSLEVLCETEIANQNVSEKAKTRFRNTITNFIRAFWHFDNRNALPGSQNDPFDQIHSLLTHQAKNLASKIDEINPQSGAHCIQTWKTSIIEAIQSVHGSTISLPTLAK